MRIAGIIAEYNPVHNGHALHIRRTREQTGCDCVIACMAGHFTQRGEPAILSKRDRARAAVKQGDQQKREQEFQGGEGQQKESRQQRCRQPTDPGPFHADPSLYIMVVSS